MSGYNSCRSVDRRWLTKAGMPSRHRVKQAGWPEKPRGGAVLGLRRALGDAGRATLSCISRHSLTPGNSPPCIPRRTLPSMAMATSPYPRHSWASGPSRLENVNVFATKHVIQGGRALGPLRAESQRLGKLGVFPAPLGDRVNAPGAAEHGAYRQGQNCRQGMAHSLGSPGILDLTQGIHQSGSPIPNALLPRNRPAHSPNSDPNYSTLPTVISTIKRPWRPGLVSFSAVELTPETGGMVELLTGRGAGHLPPRELRMAHGLR